MTVKVLFDTDIGSDIDDAVCLAYLLAQPECELLGITTVTGEADRRAMLASVLCKVAGKEVPIYPGCEEPLLIPQKQKQAPQAVALQKWEHDREFPRGQAVEFLRRTIHEHPGEVTLLAVGPLTNIGLLFKIDPGIPSLLKGLVMMCGSFSNLQAGIPRREWNALCDPHALAIVYQATTGIHRSIGLDVTRQVTMPVQQFRERLTHELHRPVLDFAEVWFQGREIVTFHDPLAATTIFDNRICGFEKGTVEVELASPGLAGMTLWTPDDTGKHEVALQVDSARFFEHYFSVFK